MAVGWCAIACGQRPLATIVAPDKIAEHTAARIVCDTTADDVRFEIFELLQLKDSRGRKVEVPGPPVAYLDFSTADHRQYAFAAPPGRYLLRFDCVDYDDRTRDLSTAVVEVVAGSSPRPVPPDDGEEDDDDTTPPDDVPEDRFGNLGRACVGWLKDMPAANRVPMVQVGRVYHRIATGLEDGTLVNITESNAEITKQLDKAIGTIHATAWNAWRAKVKDQLNGKVESRQDVIEAYRVIGKALVDNG